MSLGPTELISWEQTMMEYRSWVEEEKLKELKEEKENEEAEESLVTTSPVDLELKEEKEDEKAEESLVTTSLVDMELKELKEEKKNEEAEESLVTTSPEDLDHNDSGGSYVESLAEGEVESSVSYCNLKKTSLHPQLTISSTTTMTSHQLTSPPTCQFCSQRAEQL